MNLAVIAQASYIYSSCYGHGGDDFYKTAEKAATERVSSIDLLDAMFRLE